MLRLEVKLPIPLPSVVLLSAIVGFGEVLQQMPRAVTVPLPSEVTLPPHVAELTVILVTSVVVTVGNIIGSSGCSSGPVKFPPKTGRTD